MLFQRLEDGAAIARAVVDAEAWGFPRAIRPEEAADAEWFRMGPGVVFWFERYPITTTWFVHLAVEPSVRRRWGVRRWLRWVYAYVRDGGGSEVGFAPVPGGTGETEDYLRRLGWHETAYGLARAV